MVKFEYVIGGLEEKTTFSYLSIMGQIQNGLLYILLYRTLQLSLYFEFKITSFP